MKHEQTSYTSYCWMGFDGICKQKIVCESLLLLVIWKSINQHEAIKKAILYTIGTFSSYKIRRNYSDIILLNTVNTGIQREVPVCLKHYKILCSVIQNSSRSFIWHLNRTLFAFLLDQTGLHEKNFRKVLAGMYTELDLNLLMKGDTSQCLYFLGSIEIECISLKDYVQN